DPWVVREPEAPAREEAASLAGASGSLTPREKNTGLKEASRSPVFASLGGKALLLFGLDVEVRLVRTPRGHVEPFWVRVIPPFMRNGIGPPLDEFLAFYLIAFRLTKLLIVPSFVLVHQELTLGANSNAVFADHSPMTGVRYQFEPAI